MTNRAKPLNFIRRLNREFLPFKPEFSNFVASWRYESYGKIQNFTKFMPSRPKNTGTWGVNNTIITIVTI